MRSWLPTIALAFVTLFAVLWFSKRERPPEPQTVLAQVRQLSQLATVEYTLQKVIGLKEDKQPVGSESILLIVQARVQGGVDLASLRAEDVTVQPDGTVALHLPPAKILNLSVDEKETKVWDRQKTWWAPWIPYSLDLEQRARMTGIETVKQAALDMGILAQADRNAETSIRGLLGLAGVKSVRIVR
jgi:hypothetical protein